jgi:iron complex transport system substrate-binding protein
MHRRDLLRHAVLISLGATLPGRINLAFGDPPKPSDDDQSGPTLVALGPGALRFIVYLGATDDVAGIEGMERRAPSGRPYTYALGDLIESLPVIGVGGAGRLPDLEQLLVLQPDLAVAVTLDEQQAQMLQQRASIPILLLSYGGTGELEMSVFAESLRRLAEPLDRRARADALLGAIDNSLAALAARLDGVEPVPSYLGGISLKGQQGLASTQAGHLPLQWAGAENLANRIVDAGHRFIDLEQLLEWNPPVLFIDGGGLPAVLREAEVSPQVFSALTAVQNGQVFATLPFNAYNTNVEHAIANAWFIASRLHPARFTVFDPVAQADQIYRAFYGQPLYARLRHEQPGFARIDLIKGTVHPFDAPAA